MSTFCPHDPFKNARQAGPLHIGHFNGEEIPMILRYKDLREAARDWKTFSSDTPFRVPIPSEENVRSYRQLPIETDPPQHTAYRRLIDPIFRQPLQPEYQADIDALITRMLEETAAQDSFEAVRQFAVPLQCRAHARLLRVPPAEAEEWCRWGTHVFRDGDGETKGNDLEHYLARKLAETADGQGDDFFSRLNRATLGDRSLTHDEKMGFGNLVFAGGRDTIINTITAILGYLAGHPEALAAFRQDPRLITTATEEFSRVISAVSHIGRTCPVTTQVHGHTVPAGHRISLAFASANFDETVFDHPEEIRLDRKPNPHVAFGYGAHNCIGAPHARAVTRGLLTVLARRHASLTILSATRKTEPGPNLDRHAPYESLHLRIRLGATP